MADETLIEWADATWNPITGCSRVSTGCENCYAERLAGGRLRHHPSRARLTRPTAHGPRWTGKVRFNKQWLTQPLSWVRPRRIFVVAHGDLFAPGVSTEWVDRVWAIMAIAQRHQFIVLTKRPVTMRHYVTNLAFRSGRDPVIRLAESIWAKQDITTRARHGAICHRPDEMFPALPNVWLGASVENQETFDERWPALRGVPAAVRWLSIEPLLGDLTLSAALDDVPDGAGGLDWVVVGGESGPGSRPMSEAAAESLCREVEKYNAQGGRKPVAFFFKQWGDWGARPSDWAGPDPVRREDYGRTRVGKRAAGRVLLGRTWNEYPDVSRIRRYKRLS